MKEHVNIPMYRAQNGWTAEGWRNITNKFNDMFPTTHFTKQQVQEKEKELKGSYKIIKEARKSGVGWNDSLGMIIAEPKGWEKLIKDNHKVAKFRKKPFPLYNNLELLYEGSIAIGDLNFTSTEPPNMTTRPPIERSHSEQSTHNTAAGSDSVGINFGTNPFSEIEGPEVQSAPPYLNLEEQQSATKLGEFIDLRKIQMEKNQEKLDEKKKKEDDYSVEKYIVVVNSIEDLTIEQKADANELFQSEMNRQIFMMAKNPVVRLVWLKKKIHRYVQIQASLRTILLCAKLPMQLCCNFGVIISIGAVILEP
uniref:Myb/SANT-like domain-containing protein n=1 Tax=Setaria viridis TaxID=4556 RepID=A0A4U6U959_SETVI|nr:hypothetical protein SEVIR_5G023300v2 [Setaria viridis]